jgi:hypothetical protein
VTAALTVQHGTAEQLARLQHFRGLTDTLPEAHELDPVARFLIGRVADPREVLEHLADELDQLWSLITEDFGDDQLDELTEDDWARHSFATQQQESDHRHSATVARLVGDIEGYIWLHRVVHFERNRIVRTAVPA